MPKAVLVDDNLMSAETILAGLRALGYEGLILTGGPSGVERVTAAAPEVAFVNLASGRPPGPEIARQLRASDQLQGLRIVGYAGHVETPLLHAGRKSGCDMVVANSAMLQALPEILAKL